MKHQLIGMDSLFTGFIALDQNMESSLIPLIESIERTFLNLWDNSMKLTISEWVDRFSNKCPKTVARFVEEYRKDSEKILKRNKSVFGIVGTVATLEDYKAALDRLAKHPYKLYVMAGDTDDNAIVISAHVKAKNLLVDKFTADVENTSILEGVKNDEDGNKLKYIKIDCH